MYIHILYQCICQYNIDYYSTTVKKVYIYAILVVSLGAFYFISWPFLTLSHETVKSKTGNKRDGCEMLRSCGMCRNH